MADNIGMGKKCRKCGERKPISAFDKDSTRRGGRHPYCRNCRQSYDTARKSVIRKTPEGRKKSNIIANKSYHKHGDKNRAKTRIRSYEDNKESFMKSKYGIGWKEYYEIYDKQGGVCAICKEPETRKDPYNGGVCKLHVDHCHVTNKVRGLLCMYCNTGLGYFRDNLDLLEKAKVYLAKGGK